MTWSLIWTEVVAIDVADLGEQLEVDQIVAEHGRREGKADAERLELDRDRRRRCPARPGSGTRRRRGSSRCRPRARSGSARRAWSPPLCSSASRTTFSAMSPVWRAKAALPKLRGSIGGVSPKLRGDRDVAVGEEEVGLGAELLDHLAGHLGEAHGQHHLLVARDLHEVGDLAGRVALGERERRAARWRRWTGVRSGPARRSPAAPRSSGRAAARTASP